MSLIPNGFYIEENAILCLHSVFKQAIVKNKISNKCTKKGCGAKSKTKKIMYDLTENEDFDREEIPTYEV